jgi:hypothetical protein
MTLVKDIVDRGCGTPVRFASLYRIFGELNYRTACIYLGTRRVTSEHL